MPTPTYTALAYATIIDEAVPGITFNSIPATYRDLIIVFVGTGSQTLQGRLRLNGDTGANYSYARISGSGATATSATAASQTSGFISVIAQATITGALQMIINIMDYSATNKHKTIISRADQAANGTEAFINRWANTAAVSSVTIVTSLGNWAIGTTATLYGVIS
jgi:hypothetical protein